MKTKNLITMIKSFKSEKQAIKFFIETRWNDKIKCPFKDCIANEFETTDNTIYHLKSGHDFKCATCNKVFSYKTGTIFENSKISLINWFTAIYLHTANKKGISSCQLAKHIGTTQKTAWFMLMRIRFALKNGDFEFQGTTEVDELYLGGREKNKHSNKKGKDDKMVILGIVNRDTKQTTIKKVKSSHYHELGQQIMDNVEVGSTLVTDGFSSYDTMKKYYNHKTVNHSIGEYVRKEKETGKEAFKVHTNTVEGLFSLVRRVIDGTYHFISKKHAQTYMNEISFRYNTRQDDDFSRFSFFLGNTNVRLKYKKLIAIANA